MLKLKMSEKLMEKSLRQKTKRTRLVSRGASGTGWYRYAVCVLLECNKRQPSISTIYLLCNAFGVSMSNFMKLIEFEMSEKLKRAG